MGEMLLEIIEAGQIVELQAIEKNKHMDDSEQEAKVYRTKVFDVLSEDQLEILMPMEKTKLILLPLNGEFDVCFYTDKGLYQSFVKVVDRYKSNNVYVIVVHLISNLRKFQRREFYRFSCALEMNSRELKTEEIKAIERKEVYLVPGLPVKRSVIVDISGGGLRFIANYRYDIGELIYCKYILLIQNEEKEYHLVGKILSISELEERKGVFEHRVQFINVDADVQEEIVKYIFEEERKRRHKDNGRRN